ncbi:MAG: hypothetical protein IKI48_00550, partial [Prevotella sp.]|nr:hypothetical protein [Prevotella sp.]
VLEGKSATFRTRKWHFQAHFPTLSAPEKFSQKQQSTDYEQIKEKALFFEKIKAKVGKFAKRGKNRAFEPLFSFHFNISENEGRKVPLHPPHSNKNTFSPT